MQVNEGNFLDIVKKSFTSANAQERAQSEALLSQFMRDSSEAFVTLSTREFQNSGLPASLRTTIATILKLALRPQDREGTPSIWPALGAASRQTLKDGALTCLIDPNDQVKKAAASLTATTFALDALSDRAWSGLLPVLATNIASENVENKKAAITTLGYICELLNAEKITDLPPDKVDSLLSGICIGLKGYNESSNTAVEALSNSLQFLRTNIDNVDFCNFIFDLLVNLLIEAGRAGDEQTLRSTLICLGEIIKLVFPRFESYRPITLDTVLQCYQLKRDSVVLAVNEFFMKLLRLDRVAQTHFFDDFWRRLLGACLEQLCARSGAREDEDEGLSVSASLIHLLTTINLCYMRPSYEVLVGFISENIESQSEEAKLTALRVFEAVLEHTENGLIYDMLNSGFFGMISYLTLGSPRVKERTARLLCRIGTFHSNVAFNDQNFQKLIQEFEKIINIQAENEHILKLKFAVCECLQALADRSVGVPHGVSLLRSHIDFLFDAFLRNVEKTGSLHLVDLIFATMFAFVEKVLAPPSYNDCFLSFAEFLVAVNSKYAGDPHFKKQIIESVFINLNVLLVSMTRSNQPLKVQGKPSQAYLLELFQYICGVFTFFGEIMAEGLLLCASVVTFSAGHFEDSLDQFVTTYVVPALGDANNFDLFKAGLETISLMVKTFPAKMDRYVKDLMPYLLNLLESTTLIKELRINIFFMIADIVLQNPEAVLPHFDRLIRLTQMALSAIELFMTSDNAELVHYAESLKESIIDCYLCITHAIYLPFNIKDAEFEEAFSKLQQFIKLTSQRHLNPTFDYLRNSLGLIFDIYSKKKNKAMLDVELARYLYDIIAQYSNYPDTQPILEFAKAHLDNL